MSRLVDWIFFGGLIVALAVGVAYSWGIVFIISWWFLAYVYTQIPKFLANREAARRALIHGPRPLMYRRGRLVPWLPTSTSRSL